MSRRDGNALMAKFLTLTDGLIKPIETKKVIFTTNLNINSIDEALLRVGRTFASLNFEKLNREQASRFLQTIGATAELSGNEFSLAELYRMSRNGKGSTNGQ
jgi:ATP-dependent 26S proteasome regulatory subunit